MGDISIETKNISTNDVLSGTNTEVSDLRELKIGAGSSIFYTDKEGSRWGHTTFNDAKAWIKVDGTAQFKTSSGDVLLSTGATDGNFINIINTALNTSSKTILQGFTFGSTDYAGAFKTGNITWNEATGAITGGSGSVYNKAGLIFANAGVPTITLNGVTGAATFSGAVTGATITGGTITGSLIQTAASGARCLMTSDNGYQFYYDNTIKGKIIADNTQGIIYDTAGSSHFFRSGATEYAQINTNGILLPSNKAVIFTGGGRIIGYGGYLKVEGARGGVMDLQVEGNIYPNSDNSRNCGSSDKRWAGGWFEDISVDDITINSGGSITVAGNSGDDEEFEVVSALRNNGGTHQWKARLLTFKKGILTNMGSESSWRSL